MTTPSDFPRVHIATDHAGMELSAHLVTHLTAKGYDVVDHGPQEYDALDDYPSFCINAALAVVADQTAGVHALGIVLGGSGNGEQIAANKVKGVRAALAWNLSTATLAREHNDANVVAVGGRQHSVEEATRDHRGIPAGTVQQRRTPRPPHRQDRCLRDHRRGHRLVPEGHSVHRLARQFEDVFSRSAPCRLQPAGPVHRRRGTAGRPHPGGRCGPRQAPLPAFRQRACPARAPGPLRRLGLWR